MRLKTVVVIVLSAVAVALFWGPPFTVKSGDSVYILSGYPWVAPSYARATIYAVGGLITALFVGLSVFMVWLEKRMEELEEEYPEVGAGGVEGVAGSWGAEPSVSGGVSGGSGGKEDEW